MDHALPSQGCLMPHPRTRFFLPKGTKAAGCSPEGHPSNSRFWSSVPLQVPKAFLTCWSVNDEEILDFGPQGCQNPQAVGLCVGGAVMGVLGRGRMRCDSPAEPWHSAAARGGFGDEGNPVSRGIQCHGSTQVPEQGKPCYLNS